MDNVAGKGILQTPMKIKEVTILQQAPIVSSHDEHSLCNTPSIHN